MAPRLRFLLALAVGICLAPLPSGSLRPAPQSVSKPTVPPAASSEDDAFREIEALIRAKDYEKAEVRLEASVRNGAPPGRALRFVGTTWTAGSLITLRMSS